MNHLFKNLINHYLFAAQSFAKYASLQVNTLHEADNPNLCYWEIPDLIVE